MRIYKRSIFSTFVALALAPALVLAVPLPSSDYLSFAMLAGEYVSTGAGTKVTGDAGAVSYITTGANSTGLGSYFAGGYITTGANFVSSGSNYATSYITTGAGYQSTGSNYSGSYIETGANTANGGSNYAASYITFGAGSSSLGNYAYASFSNPSTVNSALSQLSVEQNLLKSIAGGKTLAATMGGIQTLNAGVYNATALTTAAGTQLTLDCQSNSNASWLFNIDTYLSTGAGTIIDTAHCAQGATVVWNTGGYASLGANNAVVGTVLAGTYISTGADTTSGYLLAKGYVTLGTNGTVSCLNCVVVRAVPEPETYALLLGGLGMLRLKLRSRKNTSKPQLFRVKQ